MKVYEIRIELVNADLGKHMGYKTLGFCINEDKAHKVAKAYTKKYETKQWWMSYGENAEGHINIEVIDRGEIIE